MERVPMEILTQILEKIGWRMRNRLESVSRSWQTALRQINDKEINISNRIELKFVISTNSQRIHTWTSKIRFGSLETFCCEIPADMNPSSVYSLMQRCINRVPAKRIELKGFENGFSLVQLITKRKIQHVTELKFIQTDLSLWTDEELSLTELPYLEAAYFKTLSLAPPKLPAQLRVLEFTDCKHLSDAIFKEPVVVNLERLRFYSCPGITADGIGAFLRGLPEETRLRLELFGMAWDREALEAQILPPCQPYITDESGDEVVVDWPTDADRDYKWSDLRIIFSY